LATRAREWDDRETARKETPVEVELTREKLAALLREAEQAHGEYERGLGHRDEDWPGWYADYILRALEGPSG
jgi:hypothetical protein